MALALEAYAGLANEHQEAIAELPGFDPALIQEAINLAGALRHRSAEALLDQLECVRVRNPGLAGPGSDG